MLHYACLHFMLVEMGTTMVFLSLAHDFILANIVTGFYNKLLSYFVLFTFGYEVQHMRIAINSLNTRRQKRVTQQ